ncbi:hypothetical protein GCM10018966_011140 [Streptomyces yanii]
MLTYLLLHTAAWVATAQTVWWEETFLEIMTLGMFLLLIIGIPTLLIAVIAASLHKRMDVARFRVLLAIPLLLCTWPLLASSAAEPLVFQVMAQIAFAALIPAPLFPKGWLGRSEQ